MQLLKIALLALKARNACSLNAQFVLNAFQAFTSLPPLLMLALLAL